jgi:hypothetical protein
MNRTPSNYSDSRGTYVTFFIRRDKKYDPRLPGFLKPARRELERGTRAPAAQTRRMAHAEYKKTARNVWEPSTGVNVDDHREDSNPKSAVMQNRVAAIHADKIRQNAW